MQGFLGGLLLGGRALVWVLSEIGSSVSNSELAGVWSMFGVCGVFALGYLAGSGRGGRPS